MWMRWAWLGLIGTLLGCAPARVLEPGFEDSLAVAFSCDGNFYSAYDERETIRLQIEADYERDDLPAAGMLTREYPSSDGYMRVYVGARLIQDQNTPCDDLIVVDLFGRQRLDYVYEAVAGAADFSESGGDLQVRLRNVVFRANNELLDGDGMADWPTLDDITVLDATLPDGPIL